MTTIAPPKRSREWSQAFWAVVLVVLFVPFSAPGPDGDDSKSLAVQWMEKRAKSSDEETAAASTNPSPAEAEAEDDCEALGIGNDEGPEGSCIGPDGDTMFHVVNGDSPLVLYEISVHDVTVEMTPTIAGDDHDQARASGSWISASGTWARITMTIRNEGQAPIRLNPMMFDLGVGEASFTPDRGAMEASRKSCLGKTEPLPPGRKTTCWVAFDVDRKHADDVTHSGAVIVYQPSDYDATKASQPVGLVRLRDARGGTGNEQ